MATNNTTSNQIDIIYNGYKTDISELIANIEVYEHDLPKNVMVQIAELFRVLASYENCSVGNKDTEWNSLCDTYSTIANRLYCHVIFLFLKKINEYEKLFSRYNYKGVMKDDENFVVYANRTKKQIKTSLKNTFREYYGNDIAYETHH